MRQGEIKGTLKRGCGLGKSLFPMQICFCLNWLMLILSSCGTLSSLDCLFSCAKVNLNFSPPFKREL